MLFFSKKYSGLICFLLSWTLLKAQDNMPTVEWSKKQIMLDMPFNVTVTLPNVEQIPTIQFPELEGFKKRGAPSRSINPVTVGGRSVINQIITQQYFARQEGVYNLPAFVVMVGTQAIKATEGMVVVTVPSNSSVISPDIEELEMIVPVVADAFLAVRTTKQQVFVGEGFNVTMSLFVSEDNTADMRFYDSEKQLEAIKQKLKPANCWEDDFGIREIINNSIKIRGKKYEEYRIYQASFFPLNNQPIRIPEVTWSMKVVDTKSKRTSYKNFVSRALSVAVRALPPHPLKGQVAVGDYQLDENISAMRLVAGQTYTYEFNIKGEGNLSYITAPEPFKNDLMEVYPPDQNARINHTDNTVSGQKSFIFRLIPQKKGPCYLGNTFSWVYFNPRLATYDTLHSNLLVEILGGDQASATQTIEDPFYDLYIHQKIEVEPVDYQKIIKYFINTLLLAMLIGTLFIFRKNG